MSLATALGGGLAEALSAWDNHALTYPAHILRIRKEFRQFYRCRYSDIPRQLLQKVNKVIADHRILNYPCQITMESLVRAAICKESLPEGLWLEKLVRTVEATHPQARQAYFSGLFNEYKEIQQAFANRAELQSFFELIDPVRPKLSVKNNTNDKVSLTGDRGKKRCSEQPLDG